MWDVVGNRRGSCGLVEEGHLGCWAVPTVVVFTYLVLDWLFVSICSCLFGGKGQYELAGAATLKEHNLS